ncbi:MAG TPA: hypothetical protein VGS79_28930 [Puia sp.]|nr:hypothetical protein [Puia sp.]
MNWRVVFFFSLLIVAVETGQAQSPKQDSSFSLYFNSGLSFTHANDPHINRWLKTYGYPTEPHIPTSINLELAAMPANSRVLYAVRVSTINTGGNFSSYNAMLGVYSAIIKHRSFMFLAGGMAGLHGDIVTLDGNIPPEYKEMAASHPEPLALRRRGLVLEPGVRLFWYPVNIHAVQLGFYGGLGCDMDFNSRWRLGYYSNDHGKYSHFRGLGKPSDQQRVSEYGLSYSAGLSFRIHLH